MDCKTFQVATRNNIALQKPGAFSTESFFSKCSTRRKQVDMPGRLAWMALLLDMLECYDL